MQINKMMASTGNPVYYQEAFRHVVDNNLERIMAREDTYPMTVPQALAYKHEGDLTGLLTAMGISRDYHYLVMRINDISANHLVNVNLTSLNIPTGIALENIFTKYMTKTI